VEGPATRSVFAEARPAAIDSCEDRLGGEAPLISSGVRGRYRTKALTYIADYRLLLFLSQ